MAWDTFLYLKKKLEELSIKSILGVIPQNKDEKLLNYQHRDNFFEKINSYKEYGDTIAQHGTFHKYTSSSSGILKINKRSEFAGHTFDYQYDLIQKGKKILEKNNCWQPVFMAPAHSFDDITLSCISKLGFNSITDGYGFFPFKKNGIDFVPQISARPFDIGFGMATICIHVNSMNKKQINKLVNFLKENRSRIIAYQEYKKILCPPEYIIKTLDLLSRKTIGSIRKIKNLNHKYKN